MVRGVAGRGGVVAGHGGGRRGEVLGGGGEGGGLGGQAGQLAGVDCAEGGLQGTPGRGRQVLLSVQGTEGTRTPAGLHLSFVLRAGRLFAAAQLRLDVVDGAGPAWPGRRPGVVVVVAPLTAHLLLVETFCLPELCSSVLEPNLRETTELTLIILFICPSDHQFLFLMFHTRTLMSNKPGISP